MKIEAKRVKDTLNLLKSIDPACEATRVAAEMDVSMDTIYRWRSGGCDQRTILALECLCMRALERRAEKAEAELDAIRAELKEQGHDQPDRL